MHVEARTEPIEKIVVHVNVGPEVQGGAQGLARYLQTIDAGYHKIADDKQLVTVAGDDQVVWGASGMNQRGLHICLIGSADQSGTDWLDSYSRGEMDVAAHAVADWCKQHSIPVTRLSPAQVATPGKLGICGHVDVTAAFGGANAGHYDPGPNFPWTPFLQKVLSLVHPAPPPPPKVMPMYNPPFDINDAAASINCPTGGAWLATSNGSFYGLGTAPYPGTLNDKDFFKGQRVARLELPTAAEKSSGYVVCAIAESGNRYGVK